MKATVRADIKVGANAVRGLPFADLARHGSDRCPRRWRARKGTLVPGVRACGRAVRYDENDPFLRSCRLGESFTRDGASGRVRRRRHHVISPRLTTSVYFVGARSNWYPRSAGDFAIYDLTFRYPKHLTLVTAGDVTEDRVEGDMRITRRVTPVAIRMAGFNLGEYQKVVGTSPGFHVEVYGKKGLRNAALQPAPEPDASKADPGRSRARPGKAFARS